MADSDAGLGQQVTRVRVVVRVRPLNAEELAEGYGIDVTSAATVQIALPAGEGKAAPLDMGGIGQKGAKRAREFSFDLCLGPNSTQEDVYNAVEAEQLVEAALDGFSVTVFAFGQTGAGKTHTMVGTGEEQGDSGLTGRALEAIYRMIARRVSEEEQKRVFSTSVTCLEIYNEQVFDLLQPKGAKALHVRNNPQAGFYVEKLSSFPCDSPAGAAKHLKDGLRRRAVGSHRLNAGSSRSHCIFTLSIVSEPADAPAQKLAPAGGMDPAEAIQDLAAFRRLGKISFVDLAGSERLKETRRTDGVDQGAAVWETGNINRSLFALGKVISALAERSSGRSEVAVPFRESKLTQLLIDSLGGSGRTVMVACCSPRRGHADETINTLHFAALAMQVKAKPVIMLEPKDAMLLELHRTIQQLKKENQKLAMQVQEMGAGGRPMSTSVSEFGGGFGGGGGGGAAAAGPSGREQPVGGAGGAGGADPYASFALREGRLGEPMGDDDRPKTRKGTRGGTGTGAGGGSLSGPIPYPPNQRASAQGARAAGGRAAGGQRGGGGRQGGYSGVDSPLSSSSTEPNLPRWSDDLSSDQLRDTMAVDPSHQAPWERAASADESADQSVGDDGGSASALAGGGYVDAENSFGGGGGDAQRSQSQYSASVAEPPPADDLDKFPGLAALEAQFRATLGALQSGAKELSNMNLNPTQPPAKKAPPPKQAAAPAPQAPGRQPSYTQQQPQPAASQRSSGATGDWGAGGGGGAANAATADTADSAAAGAPDPKAVSWAKANPWFGNDSEMTEFAYKVHDELVGQQGMDPASDAYYAALDSCVQARFPGRQGAGPAPLPPRWTSSKQAALGPGYSLGDLRPYQTSSRGGQALVGSRKGTRKGVPGAGGTAGRAASRSNGLGAAGAGLGRYEGLTPAEAFLGSSLSSGASRQEALHERRAAIFRELQAAKADVEAEHRRLMERKNRGMLAARKN